MALLWRNELPIAVLNGGFMGPSDEAVIHMIREALRGPDDVDQLGKCGAPTAERWQLIPLRCHQWRWKIFQKMEVWMGKIAINGGVSMSTFDYRRVFDGSWPKRHGTKNNDFR